MMYVVNKDDYEVKLSEIESHCPRRNSS